MHLVVNTTGKQVQAFGIYFLVCKFIDLAIYLLNKTILNKYISNKLLVFINNIGGFYEDRRHGANITESLEFKLKSPKSLKKKVRRNLIASSDFTND